MRKLGLISLALVLALGALGAAYAPWTDDVEIVQTVTTGDLAIGFSKCVPSILFDDKDIASIGYEFTGEIVGYVEYPWGLVPVYEGLEIWIDNAYPCIGVTEIVDVASVGTIPVHITSLDVFGVRLDEHGNVVETLTWEAEWIGKRLQGRFLNDDGVAVIDMTIVNLVGEQLHEGWYTSVEIDKHFKQAMEQNATYVITIKITGTQYNWP